MIITKELLERFHEGSCTEEERKAVEKWLASSDNFPSELDPLQRKDFEKSTEAIWSKFSQAVPELEKEDTNRRVKVLALPGRITRYAAAVLLFCVVSFSAYYVYNSVNASDNGQIAELYKTSLTKRGEKKTVTLADGSKIRMNYETEIRIPEKFERNNRVVYLKGHAHFDVARNPEKPFIVYTEDTKTQVLGTSFDINTKGPDETEIIVTSGKVAFSEKARADNLVTLSVNDRALLSAGKSIATTKVDAQKLTAWKDNRLVFDGETLREIIEILEPWYDVEVSVADPGLLLQDFKYAKDNPTLKTVLDKLAFMGRFEYRIEGKEVVIF